MSVFTSIQDSDLVRSIAKATTRLVYMAPGVSKAIAGAIKIQIQGQRLTQIAIVIDGDEECCRLGYCDAEALADLNTAAQEHDIALRRHAGLRLGLLMADDDVLIWTPTPLMFEAPRGESEPNGLILTPQTLKELPQALGVDPQSPPAQIEVGKVLVAKEELAKVVDAIKAAPPAPFDLSRLSRVFSARFQFIETVLRGAELTKRELRLDSLIVNSDAPEELRPLLQTTIQPFNTDADKTVDVPVLINGEQAYRQNGEKMTKPTTQAEIHAYWNELTQKYIINLPGFGKLIRHTDKTKFEAGKADFEVVLTEWVNGFREVVKGDHETRVSRVVDLIVQRMANEPEKKRLNREAIQTLVRKGLDNLRVIDPSVKVVYKNITVESTRDKEFLEVLRKAVPARELANWFQIFDAAAVVPLGQRK
ncbi:hypothetical protein [Rhodoferax antarcticus]|uniref:hypothetical protein n=1 Tax=Rhodoferax antarcticus TaxID=81479 RepID=UPI002224E0A7|nr:hypothetical protein [Rhodoferax antarcticus]MCW2312734.1 hypothetical protein [Rhodoferax antarcticus]